jgi:hypothetical protein
VWLNDAFAAKEQMLHRFCTDPEPFWRQEHVVGQLYGAYPAFCVVLIVPRALTPWRILGFWLPLLATFTSVVYLSPFDCLLFFFGSVLFFRFLLAVSRYFEAVALHSPIHLATGRC